MRSSVSDRKSSKPPPGAHPTIGGSSFSKPSLTIQNMPAIRHKPHQAHHGELDLPSRISRQHRDCRPAHSALSKCTPFLTLTPSATTANKRHPSDLGSADKQHLVPKNVTNRMSALPPKADIAESDRNVRFTPESGHRVAGTRASF